MEATYPPIPARKRISEALVSRVVRGVWGPGRQVKPGDVAGELNLGMTPAREALIELEAEGWLVNEQGRGFFVAALSLREARELYPVIAELECLAVRSVGAVTPADLERLAARNEEFRSATDPGAGLEADGVWHETLVGLADNATLADATRRLRVRARRYEYTYMSGPADRAASSDEHHAIALALRAGDVAAAVDLVRRNWMKMLDYLAVRVR